MRKTTIKNDGDDAMATNWSHVNLHQDRPLTEAAEKIIVAMAGQFMIMKKLRLAGNTEK
jgi:hypothetical protein